MSETEQTKGVDVRLLLLWKAVSKAVRAKNDPNACCQLSADHLDILVDAYMERAALQVVNDQMEQQGAEIAPYWAHHMMAMALRKEACPRGADTCRTSSLCITEYCAGCYARVWWESQHKHGKRRHPDGMLKKETTR